jgi:hypothetical protein
MLNYILKPVRHPPRNREVTGFLCLSRRRYRLDDEIEKHREKRRVRGPFTAHFGGRGRPLIHANFICFAHVIADIPAPT